MTPCSKRYPPAPWALLLALLFLPAWAMAAAVPHREQDPPTLVVVLVVDQLRGDLLERYSSVFRSGFHRLLNEGLVHTNALHSHAATETSPGHAAISTGTHPARAGIPANAWREGEGSSVRTVNHVIDPGEGLVGAPGLPGASPRVLRRTGLADWTLEADPRARVVSISAKARAAVLMGGKSRGDVFWFDSQVGRFVTSTFYRQENPPWLDRFNREVLEGYRADSVWASTIPGGMEGMSAPDSVSAEGDGVHTAFPHRYGEERPSPGTDDFFLWFEETPMLDAATLDLARTAVLERGLGKERGRTDFLSVSLSQTDRVGHAFGPLSREQMDNLLRLDRELGFFLDLLDREVGPGRYVVGFTADHGVMTLPEREGASGRRLTEEDRGLFQQALGQAAQGAGQEASPLAPRLVRALHDLPFAGPAFTHGELGGGVPGDSLLALYERSFVPGRGGGRLSAYGVEMWWAENILDWAYPRGTTHGSPFLYDRWVPLILLGQGIRPSVVGEGVSPLDLAPTLAALAGIPYPADLDGRPLLPGRR